MRNQKPGTKQRQKTHREITNEQYELQKQREINSMKKGKLTKEELLNRGIELSIKQNELYKGIRNNTLTVCQGPAGTSKTFTACYTSLALLADKKIDQIILTKPIQESGENLGFLPGTVEEKVDPYMKSYFSNFEKIIGKASFEWLKSTEQIIVEPLAYMRGTTYDRSIMLLDEAQNCTMTQLMLWVTRLGSESKAILMGDVSQYDIKKRDSKFLEFIQLIDGVQQVNNFRFGVEDIVRNKFLIDIVDRYEKWKYESGQ
jgi:phosphate starvation-inducible PhoH-like protein